MTKKPFTPKIKKLNPSAKIHVPAKYGDVGCDVCIVEESQPDKDGDIEKSGYVDVDGNIVFYTGIAVELPVHPDPNKIYYTRVLMKSSGSKYPMILANCEGVIDWGYRGEIVVKFKPTPSFSVSQNVVFPFMSTRDMKPPEAGTPIVQFIFSEAMKVHSFDFVDKLGGSDRGEMGYGDATQNRMCK